jgi:hypothetical protein
MLMPAPILMEETKTLALCQIKTNILLQTPLIDPVLIVKNHRNLQFWSTLIPIV